jgi:hypothetical protein
MPGAGQNRQSSSPYASEHASMWSESKNPQSAVRHSASCRSTASAITHPLCCPCAKHRPARVHPALWPRPSPPPSSISRFAFSNRSQLQSHLSRQQSVAYANLMRFSPDSSGTRYIPLSRIRAPARQASCSGCPTLVGRHWPELSQ